jgi:hypothetical protein
MDALSLIRARLTAAPARARRLARDSSASAPQALLGPPVTRRSVAARAPLELGGMRRELSVLALGAFLAGVRARHRCRGAFCPVAGRLPRFADG